jgi:hypothetical protein
MAPRKKDGETQDWSVVENKRVAGGQVVLRRVLAEDNELYVYAESVDRVSTSLPRRRRGTRDAEAATGVAVDAASRASRGGNPARGNAMRLGAA